MSKHPDDPDYDPKPSELSLETWKFFEDRGLGDEPIKRIVDIVEEWIEETD